MLGELEEGSCIRFSFHSHDRVVDKTIYVCLDSELQRAPSLLFGPRDLDRASGPMGTCGTMREGHRAKRTSELIFIDILSPIRFCLLKFPEPDHCYSTSCVPFS